MTEASLHLSEGRESISLCHSDEENSSIRSLPVSHVTNSTSGKGKSKQKETKTKAKSSTSTTARTSAKLDDLSRLEDKLSEKIENRFSSLDGKFEKLFGLLTSKGTDLRGPQIQVENSTTGACIPQTEADNTDTSGGREPLIPLDNSLNRDYGLTNHFSDRDDVLSLQPGQKERHGIGLLSSEEDVNSCVEQEPQQAEQIANSRFGKYTLSSRNDSKKENEPLTYDLLTEMFGEDVQTDTSSSSGGLCLDKAQVEIINSSWRCQTPDKISAYKEISKQSFPISDNSEKTLKVPSLDELTERLLIKRHGRKAAFGSSQSLFSQPFKSLEKIAFQGQVAARLGIISICYTQQALGQLLNNLKSSSPNLDEAVQNVRDIFAMSTKSLDQVARTGTFHHLVRRKATIADTGLDDFKDLQKAALTSPLSGEGIFGSEFEKKLKDRQEKDKQLSELMPEMNKKFYGKRKTPFQAESSSQKKFRQHEDFNKPYNKSSSYNSCSRRTGKSGGHYFSNYKGNSSKNSSVRPFRFQTDRNNKA